MRRQGAEVQFGFRVEQRHVNTMGNLHGGMMATFCDMLLPLSVHHKTTELEGRFLPTISLQVDYLAPVRLGMWVQGEAGPLRITRSLVFAQGLVTADGEPCARVSGVFKIGPEVPGMAVE
nr:PaaI family thioesterase [Acidovorax sp. sic0104]